MLPLFFVVLVSIFLQQHHGQYCDVAAKAEKVTCSSSTSLVLAPQRDFVLIEGAAAQDPSDFVNSSQSRSTLSLFDPLPTSGSDAYLCLALPVWAHESQECHMVRDVRGTMGFRDSAQTSGLSRRPRRQRWFWWWLGPASTVVAALDSTAELGDLAFRGSRRSMAQVAQAITAKVTSSSFPTTSPRWCRWQGHEGWQKQWQSSWEGWQAVQRTSGPTNGADLGNHSTIHSLFAYKKGCASVFGGRASAVSCPGSSWFGRSHRRSPTNSTASGFTHKPIEYQTDAQCSFQDRNCAKSPGRDDDGTCTTPPSLENLPHRGSPTLGELHAGLHNPGCRTRQEDHPSSTVLVRSSPQRVTDDDQRRCRQGQRQERGRRWRSGGSDRAGCRRGDGQQLRGQCPDSRGYCQYAGGLGDFESQGRRHGSLLRKACQEIQKWARCCRGCWHVLPIFSTWSRGFEAFWRGRQEVTTEYPCRWPGPQGLFKWLHTVAIEDDFKTEWGASWSAYLFAFDINGVATSSTHSLRPGSSSLKGPVRRAGTVAVTFDETIELLFYDSNVSQTSFLSHQALSQWFDKPWSCEPQDCITMPATPSSSGSSRVVVTNSFRTTKIHRSVQHNPWAEAPSWTQELWDSLFLRQAEPVTTQEPATLQLLSWFLDGERYVQCDRSRSLVLGPDWWNWDAQVRSLWHDRLDQARTYALYIVWPEPPRTEDEHHQAHVLVSQIRDDRRAVLLSVAYENSYGDKRLWREAHALTSPTNNDGLFAQIPRAFRFRAGDASRCLIVVGERVVTALPFDLAHGDGPVLYHCLPRIFTEEDPLETDLVNFMSHPPTGPCHDAPTHVPLDEIIGVAAQQDPAALPGFPGEAPDEDPEGDLSSEDSPTTDSADEDWYSVVVYSLDHIPVAGRAVWTSYERLHRSLAHLLEVNPHDLQAFWHVVKAPTELEAAVTHVFVGLLHWDFLPGSTLRLALLDVEFYAHAPGKQPQVVREARLVPHQTTRSQLFQALGIARYCDEVSQSGCLFWINDQLQPSQFQGHCIVQHGDYLRIAVPPDVRLCDAFDTRTAVGLSHQGASLVDLGLRHPQGLVAPETARLVPLVSSAQDASSFMQSPGSGGCPFPPYDFDPVQSWRNELYYVWREDVVTTQPEEPYIVSWFLDHGLRRLPRQDTSRVVVLPPDFAVWRSRIVDTWADLIDASAPVLLHVVRPSPQRGTLPMRRPCAHVLVTQHKDRTRASVLFSVHNFVQDFWQPTLFAAVVNELSLVDGLLETADLHHSCADWMDDLQCEVSVAGRLIDPARPVGVDIGDLIFVEAWKRERTADAPASQTSDPGDQDLLGLLQVRLEAAFSIFAQHLSTAAYDNWLQVCRLEDVIELPESGPLFEETAPAEPIAVPLPLDFARDAPVWTQLLYPSWYDALSPWDEEERAASVLVWYLDAPRFHECLHPRLVWLPEAFDTWEDLVKRAWDDFLDRARPVGIHVVAPTPWDLEPHIIAHLIVVQNAPLESVAALLSTFDARFNHGQPLRKAAFVECPVSHRSVLRGLHPQHPGLDPDMPLECATWHGTRELTYGAVLPGHHGVDLAVTIEERPAPTFSVEVQAHDDTSLLQQPPRRTLLLDELIPPVDLPDHERRIVDLIAGAPIDLLPPFLEIWGPFDDATITQELQQWGIHCHVFCFGPRDAALCLPLDFQPAQDQKHYMYANQDLSDSAGAFLHTTSSELSEPEHLRFLHSVGYAKAVLTFVSDVGCGFTLVTFLISAAQVESTPARIKHQRPWPLPHTRHFSRPDGSFLDFFQDIRDSEVMPACLLGFDFSWEDLQRFLTSSLGMLEDSLQGLELPDFVQSALSSCDRVDPLHPNTWDIDRLLIYTDGSSASGSRLDVPDRYAVEDSPIDSWAFIVIGERFAPVGSQQRFVLIGWLTHPVLYQQENPHFLGADRIGSDISEREALFFGRLVAPMFPIEASHSFQTWLSGHMSPSPWTLRHTTTWCCLSISSWSLSSPPGCSTRWSSSGLSCCIALRGCL